MCLVFFFISFLSYLREKLWGPVIEHNLPAGHIAYFMRSIGQSVDNIQTVNMLAADVVKNIKEIKGIAKIPKISTGAKIDDLIFRLHYRLTSGCLFILSVLTTAFNFAGRPIVCATSGMKGKGKSIIPVKFMDTYCWVQSTFTLPGITCDHPYSRTNCDHPYPGIGPDVNMERRYHSYYQWVPLVLFLQGVFFYAPRWFWKNWEQKTIEHLSEGLRGHDLAADRTQKTELLIKYVKKTFHKHNIYAFGYYFCVFWNFINVIANIYLVDVFLGHAFMTYGTDVLNFASAKPQENRTDPISKVFPIMTKCHFQNYGSSGSIQLHDALCVLPVNLLNERVYIYIWFWFVVLAILSALAVIHCLAILTFPSLRVGILQRKLGYKVLPQVENFIRGIHFGDFFFLSLLSENISDSRVFGKVFEGVSNRVTQNHVNSPKKLPVLVSADDEPIIFPSSIDACSHV